MEAEIKPPARGRRRLWTALACGIIVLAAVAVCRNGLRGQFVFDDVTFIEEAGSGHPWAAWRMLTGPRPVAQTTLALNYALGGSNPTGYHVGNMLIHILAALTLFGIVRRTLLLSFHGARFDERSAGALAFAAGLLWAVHPLQTQAVTYIIQRMESLMGLFYLLTLYCFIRSTEVSTTETHGNARLRNTEETAGRTVRLRAFPWLNGPAPWWSAAAVAACALGMGCKEVMVSAPLIVLLYDRTFVAGSFREALRRRWGLYLALAATWLIVAPWVLAAFAPAGKQSAGFNVVGLSSMQYARSEFGVILHYLRLAFWPAGLCLDYDWPIANGLKDILPGAIAVGALLAATVWAMVRAPKLGFIGAWFFLILAPTSSIMPIEDLALEYRMYLPLAAVIVTVVLAAWFGWERISESWANAKRAGQIVAAIALIGAAAALGRATQLRNRVYATAISVWQDTVKKAPLNARAWNNLGWHLRHSGDPVAALDCFDEAIELKRRYAEAYNNRAFAYAELRRYGQAFSDWTQALDIQPDFPAVYNNRGKVYLQLGKIPEALKDLGQAIRLRPDYYAAYNNRGVAQVKAGHYSEALEDFNKAIEIRPDDPAAYGNRALAWSRMKEYAKAQDDLKTSERLGGHIDAGLRKTIMDAAERTARDEAGN